MNRRHCDLAVMYAVKGTAKTSAFFSRLSSMSSFLHAYWSFYPQQKNNGCVATVFKEKNYEGRCTASLLCCFTDIPFRMPEYRFGQMVRSLSGIDAGSRGPVHTCVGPRADHPDRPPHWLSGIPGNEAFTKYRP